MAATEKISVTIGRDELRHARRLAARLRLNLSAFITEAVRNRIEQQARKDAAEAVLGTFAPEDRATPEEMRQLLAAWHAPCPRESKGTRARSMRRSPSKLRATARLGSRRH